MKKWWIIIIIVILLLVIGAYFWYYNYYRCSLDHWQGCGTRCKIDSDCKMSINSGYICGCINKDEKQYSPHQIMTVCYMVDCKCINNTCVGISK